MLYSKYLTKRQRGVLVDLFSGKFTEREVLEKRKVTRRTYHRWHAQEYFAAEYKRLLELVRSESQLVFARYSSDIAMKLVTLAAAEKEETARKACMDVIVNHDNKTKLKGKNDSKPIEEPLPELPPEVASRLLAALANDDDDDDDDDEKDKCLSQNQPAMSGIEVS
jgi:membrane carboxypeptidase/penicillin-binding protein